jgi:hypothetical protein
MAPNLPRTVDLDHRAFHLRGAPRQSLCVAAAGEGALTLIDVDSGQASSVAGLPKIRDVSPHPSQRLLALIDDGAGKLSVVDFNGSRLLEQEAPRFGKRVPSWQRPGFDGCFFDQNGNDLWSVVHLSPDAVEVQLRETERWSVVGSVAVKDPFEESSCSFHATSKPDVAALWLAAGQDGQRVYWVTKYADSLGVEPEPFLEDTTPPVFAPKRNEFLVIDDLMSVCKYQFPPDRKLGTCHSKWGEEDYFGDCLCYLDDTTALVHSHHGRLFRIDLRAMKVREEMTVRGHEPRPVEEYYPTLVGDKTLCTDIAYFARFGEIVVLGYHRETGTEVGKWKDTLMFYDVDSIARKTASSEGH